jgi:hypothetical protein
MVEQTNPRGVTPPRTFALLVAGAGGAIVAGVALPWVKATSRLLTLERSGFDYPDGKLLAWIGAGVVLAGLLAAFVSLRAWLKVAILGGLAALYAGIVDYGDVSKRGSDTVTVSVGFGLYLCIIGGTLTVVFAVLGLRASSEKMWKLTTPPGFAPPTGPAL